MTALRLLLALALAPPGPGAPLTCPTGAALAGAAWPEGFEQWCEKPDDAGRPQRHGPGQGWYDDGGLRLQSTWTMGRLDGPFVERYRNGKKAREGAYRDGEKEGRWTVWFEDGRPAEEAGYEKGFLHGRFATFFSGGAKRVEGRYCHGIQCGRWTNWDEGGRELGQMVHEEIRQSP